MLTSVNNVSCLFFISVESELDEADDMIESEARGLSDERGDDQNGRKSCEMKQGTTLDPETPSLSSAGKFVCVY